MSTFHIIAFATASALLIAVPGPRVLFSVVALTLDSGWAFFAGSARGQFTYATALETARG